MLLYWYTITMGHESKVAWRLLAVSNRYKVTKVHLKIVIFSTQVLKLFLLYLGLGILSDRQHKAHTT